MNKPASPQSEFNRITLSRYNAMQVRFGQKVSKKGRVMRVGREIPFTVAEYREWIMGCLDGGNCKYCHKVLNIHSFRADHMTPPDRGGSMGFDNLAPCCDDCNMEKGGITARAYQFLRECLDQLPEADRADIRSRLRSALKLAQLHRRDAVRLMQLQPKPTGKTF